MVTQVVYSVPLLVTGIAAIILMAYVWKRRTVPAAAPLLGLLCSLAFWCIPCAFEPFSGTVAARLLWMRLELPAITCVSAFYLLVALEYTGFRCPRWACAALFMVPAALQIAAWTNSQWYWRRIWIKTSSPLRLTGIDWGPGFWCFLVFAWAVTAASILLIVRQLVRAKGSRRRETAIFLASTVVPLIVNVPDVLGLTPGWPDLTPFAFALTAAGIAWVLFRFRFQAIIPVAWTAIFQGMDDGVLVLDAENRIVVANFAAERFLKSSNQHLIGRSMGSASGNCPGLGRLAEVESNEGDIEFGSGSERRICEVRVSQLRDKRKQLIGRVLTIRDVNAVRAAARELDDARKAAEAASRAKSEFLANMSHEIRTPMNGVLGMTELALETDLTPDQRDYLSTVQTSAESLLTIINDILDFSKIEARKLDLDPVPIRLQAVIEEATKLIALRAHQKGLEIVCSVDAAVPEWVIADGARVRQILLNLLGNAVKFTDGGEVSLRVETMPSTSPDASGLHLRFSVCDTGIGIPPEKQETIFQAFAQADGSTTRRYGGTGLGLTISQRLAEMMGGCIGVESKLGQGSTFWFTIAATAASCGDPGSPLDHTCLHNMPVLVVDDNATNRRILAETLSRWGMRPMIAESGMTALHLLGESASAIPIILTDLHMPEMDGFELSARVRLLGSSPIVVMLTSGSRNGDVGRCRELGIDAYLTKPVGQVELHATFLRVLGARDTVRAEAGAFAPDRRPAPTRATMAPCRILLAEDNPVNQKVAMVMLQRAGHSVVAVTNGRDAVESLARESFDLVFMDVQMPEMDGFEATAAIRAQEQPGARRVPIIAMTAHAMAGDDARCLSAGMDAYIAKPVQQATLLAAVARARSSAETKRIETESEEANSVLITAPER